MDKNASKRWRPVIETLFDNLTRQEAIEATLLLLDAPGQKIVTVPSEPSDKPEAAPRRPRLRSIPGGRADSDETEPPDASKYKEKAQLDPLAFFTLREAAAYLDIGPQRLYQILQTTPEKLPHKRETGARGKPEYRINGRGLNALRYERAKGADSAATSE